MLLSASITATLWINIDSYYTSELCLIGFHHALYNDSISACAQMAVQRGRVQAVTHKPNKREKEAVKWPWKIYRSRAEEEDEQEARDGDNVRGG